MEQPHPLEVLKEIEPHLIALESLIDNLNDIATFDFRMDIKRSLISYRDAKARLEVGNG